ncbi:hypothetical protein [Kitasatospora viridis]|uniref:Uncharacterized protein n=1 Tax=Kitasatospora viridis TaxID=281105 RepID=A0A561SA51_9ACTN|nr:hypothetical protein [Kitasatospora viridis]TWF71750.1 hypothetical protein FHX73_18121 [Kitasatospora viridis]
MAKKTNPDVVILRAYIVLRPSDGEKISGGDFGTLSGAVPEEWDGHSFELYDGDGETIALLSADVRCEDMRRAKLAPDVDQDTVAAAWEAGETVA